MAIQTISQILVNNSQFIFGGAIYNARYSVSMGDSQSTVKISVISESGDYNISPATLEKTYCNPYTIQIGSQIVFTGFLESYAESVSPSGKILELEFVDNSRILDITAVGLYKRHGLTSTKRLLIVGKEIDSCNPDGYANPVTTFFNPCNPCITDAGIQAKANFIDCEDKKKYEILDVKYNFTELLQKISTIPIKIIGAVDINPKYLTQHTGSLREVLSAWCNDFGFFFYWENNSIIFKDLRNTIQVSAAIENFCPNLLEYNSRYSMKDSFKTATITAFTRAGNNAKFYTCKEAKYIECESLQQNNNYSMPLTISPKIDRIAAGLANYSAELRDLYYFYTQYQMYNSANFVNGRKLPKLGMTILSPQFKLGALAGNGLNINNAATPQELKDLEPSKLNIDPFGTNVIPAAAAGLIANANLIKANADFFNCVQLLDAEHQWKIVANPNNYYFFLARKNETINNNFLQEEKDFASFLHKYAVYVPDPNDPFFEDYDFELDNLCNYQYFINTGNVSYGFLGDTTGNAQLYNTSSQGNGAGFGHIMGDLPFARFLTIIRDTKVSTSSTNTQLQFKLIVAERGRNSFIPDNATQYDDDPEPIRDYNMLARAKSYLPYQVANKNSLNGKLIGRILNGADPSAADASDVFLYLGHAATQNDFRITQIPAYNDLASFGTLFDGVPSNKQDDPTLQTQEIIYQYPELKCSILGNHSYGGRTTLHATKVVFHTPISEFKYTEPTNALFGLVIEKTSRKRRIIKKVESFNSTNIGGGEGSNKEQDSCNYAKLLVNSRNISDERLNILTKTNNICQFDSDKIQKIHEEFVENLATNYTQPTISKTFKIAGLELNGYTPSIENGLISLEVGIDDKGVFSTYEFGTRLMILPKEDSLIYGKNLNIMGQPGSRSETNNYFPLVGRANA